MKADQIGAQQAVEQFRLPGTDAEGLGIRPWNVPKNSHAGVGTGVLDETRQQRKVVILHQHDRIVFVLHFFEERPGKFPVDGLIVFPVFDAECRAGVRDVAERPQPFIGKTEVEALLLFLGEPHAAERVLGMVRRDAHAVVFIDGLAIGGAAGLRDPSPIAGAQDGFEGGDQSAGRHRAFDPGGAVEMLVGFAIGHRKQAASF